jgi:hypothetical protein
MPMLVALYVGQTAWSAAKPRIARRGRGSLSYNYSC